MTTSPCQTLDAYLDGRLSASEEAAFEAHLADCETCIGVTDEVTLAFRSLADATCPPDVLDRALAEARRPVPARAADRAALPLASRRSALGWRQAVLPFLALLVAGALWITFDRDDPAAPQFAATDPGPAAVPATPPAPPPPETDPVEEPSANASEAPTPAPTSTPRMASPPAVASRSAPAPPPAPEVTTPEALTSDAPTPQFAQNAPADSVETAKEELLYAFALVADAQDHAADAVADGVGRFSDALRSTPLASPHQP